jgi:hypothetical protein
MNAIAPLILTPADDLAASLSTAPAGSRIRLAPGRHGLFRAVRREADLTLEASPGATLAIDALLSFEGVGTWALLELNINVAGPTAGLRADAGHLKLADCALSGGSDARCGLRLSGNARATLTDTTLAGFAGAGVVVRDKARLEAHDCRFLDNRGPGLSFESHSGGLLRNNLIERNGQAGVRVAGNATPELEGNIVLGNHGPGLHFVDAATGGAYGNLLEGNHRQGVLLEGECRPALEHNTLRKNVGGLRYAEASGGYCRHNACDGNLGHDILLAPAARPHLQANQAVVEREHGLTGAIRRAVM